MYLHNGRKTRFSVPLWAVNMAYFEFKTNLRLGVSDRQGNYAFVQESSYIQGILSYINEKDTSFLDYKHKHMLENGAPPDKFGVLYRLLVYRIMLYPRPNSFFLEMVCLPLREFR